MDQSGAEVAVVGVGVYRHTLEKASIVLAYGYELLGLIELGELQNLCFGKRRHAKAGTSGEARNASTTCVFSSSKTEHVA